MQRVRHHDAIEWRQVEPLREISVEIGNARFGKAAAHRLFLRSQRPAIPVHRIDLPHWANQVGKSQRKSASPRTEVCPRASGSCYAFAQEKDMVVMIHILPLPRW